MVGGRKEPFDGVALGPLLGKGSFGRVYRALWDGKPVAVKVRRLISQSTKPSSQSLKPGSPTAICWNAIITLDRNIPQRCCCCLCIYTPGEARRH